MSLFHTREISPVACVDSRVRVHGREGEPKDRGEAGGRGAGTQRLRERGLAPQGRSRGCERGGRRRPVHITPGRDDGPGKWEAGVRVGTPCGHEESELS